MPTVQYIHIWRRTVTCWLYCRSLDRLWEESERNRNISAADLMALILSHATGSGNPVPTRTGTASSSSWRPPSSGGGSGGARADGGIFTARQLRLLGDWAAANYQPDASKLVHVLRRSVALAKSTCRQLFAGDRWNCPVNYQHSLGTALYSYLITLSSCWSTVLEGISVGGIPVYF